MMPAARGRENASSGVFLTVPRRVAMNTHCSVAKSRTASIAVIRSPSSSASRLTIGLPREPRPASGSWNTRSQYTRPRLEKHRSVSWVRATNSRSMKSSSFIAVAFLPRPPRFCRRYSLIGCDFA